MRRAILAALAIALTACAGGAADDVDRDASTLDIRTTGRKSGQPRTATIWFVWADRLYVQSGKEGETDWYRNLLKTPDVTVRIGDRELRGRATPVTDPAEVDRVHELFKQKYFTARVMSLFGGGFGAGKVVAIDLSP